MSSNKVRIYINNKEREFEKSTVMSGLDVIKAAGKNPDSSTVQYKKNHGEGHPYEEFLKERSIELKNHMSFKVIEDIDNGKKN